MGEFRGSPAPSPRNSRALRRAGAAALTLAVATAIGACGAAAKPLFTANLQGPDRLLTNEYAEHNPDAPGIVRSAQWFVTSGSLFLANGALTDGHIDHIAANARSSHGTNSAVFRAYTRQHFSGNYQVTFDLWLRAPQAVAGLETASWDGLHLIINAQSPSAAYYVSLYRRDGQAVIKKKSAGGPIAGGSYQELSKYVPSTVRPQHWTELRIDVRRSEPDAETIDLYEGGALLITATDAPAVTGSPSFGAGRLGIRADKTRFAIKDFSINRL
jgi:hypothetical protein